jgi:hypothetical protein
MNMYLPKNPHFLEGEWQFEIWNFDYGESRWRLSNPLNESTLHQNFAEFVKLIGWLHLLSDREYFIIMDMSSLPMKGYKIRPLILSAIRTFGQGGRSRSSLPCHTCFDTGPRSHPQHDDIPIVCRKRRLKWTTGKTEALCHSRSGTI